MNHERIAAARATVSNIAARLCQKHGIGRQELLGPGKARRFSIPRQELYYEAHLQTGLGCVLIGKLLNRHHMPVQFGITRHKARLEKAQSGEHKEAGE